MNLIRANFGLFIVFGIILSFIVNVCALNFSILFWDIEDLEVDTFERSSMNGQLFMGLILAPFLESFLFQYLPIRLFQYFEKPYFTSIGIIISALVFAASHYYSWAYMFVTFFVGLAFAWLYLFGKNNFNNGFVSIVLIHAGMNALAFIEF